MLGRAYACKCVRCNFLYSCKFRLVVIDIIFFPTQNDDDDDDDDDDEEEEEEEEEEEDKKLKSYKISKIFVIRVSTFKT